MSKEHQGAEQRHLRLINYTELLQDRAQYIFKRKIRGIALEAAAATGTVSSIIYELSSVVHNDGTGVRNSVISGALTILTGLYGEIQRGRYEKKEMKLKEEVYYKGLEIVGKIRPTVQKRHVVFEYPKAENTTF